MMTKTRNSKKLSPRSRLLRERANMSFFIVIMFFAVFGVIVLTEIFLIDERGRGAGVMVGRGPQGGVKHKPDYEDQALLQNEDYLVYRGSGFDDNMGMFVREDRAEAAIAGDSRLVDRVPRGGPFPLRLDPVKAIPSPREKGGGNVPAGLESRLPGVGVNVTARDGVWQSVGGTRYKFYVFSAFYDRRQDRSIRIIGATKTRGHEAVWCRLWYNINGTSNLKSVSVAARVKVIRENWNLKYSACFILCPLHKNLTAPSSVSVVSRLRSTPSNHLIVQNTDSELALKNVTPTSIPEKLAICVKPLHFKYNQAVQMLEFLELNAILGVDHFTLYNHTLGPAVGCILQDYVRRGIVTLLPWKLNMVSQKEIRTEGLFAALNDCLYRSMYRYSHVALVDLDEFIMPRHNDTLLQLIKWMGTLLNTRTTGSYSFQNAFFYLQWGDDKSMSDSTPLESGLVTLRKTRRRTKLHPHKQRSKYLCRPDFVVEAGNHFVWEFVPGHGTLNVPPDAAILHHYRVCEFGGDDCVKSASVIDRTAYRYRDRLSERVQARWGELKALCGLPELTRDATTTTVATKTVTSENIVGILSRNLEMKHRQNIINQTFNKKS